MQTHPVSLLRPARLMSFRHWIWAAVICSIGICVAVSWLYFVQSQTMARMDRTIDHLRESRIELAKGFLYVLSSNDAGDAFQKQEGMSLLNQAIVTLERNQIWNLAENLQSKNGATNRADFERQVLAFRAQLNNWASAQSANRSELGLKLRVAFHQLEYQASLLDQASDETLDALIRQYDLRFALAMVLAFLLQCGICTAVYVTGRNEKAALADLRKSEERLRLVGDNLPDTYVYQYVREPDGRPRFTYVSAGVERVHGLPQSEVLRDAGTLHDLVLPEDRAVLDAAISASAEHLTDFEVELRVKRPDGETRLVLLRSRPYLNSAGRIQWDGIATDITERRQAEEMLHQKDVWLREMSAMAHIGGWEFNPATGEGGWTDEVARIHDMDPAAPTSKAIGLSVYHGPSREKIESALKAAIERGVPYDLELEMVTLAGNHKRVRTQGVPLLRDGRVERISGTIQDITERKYAEAALRESEKRHRNLFECSRDAILTSDPVSGKFTSGNPAALKMFGAQTEEEFVSYTPADLSPERQLDGSLSAVKAKEIVETVVREGSHFFEWTHRRINGKEFIANVLLTRIEQNGKPMIMSTIRDITTAKKVEAALKQSEEQFRAMFEMASIGMAQADPQTGQWLRVNQRMCAITGYSAAEMLQMGVPEITHPDDRARDWEALQRVVRGEASEYRMEKRYIRKDGTVAWVNVNVTILRDTAGQPVRSMATIEDISERKRAETALRESEERFRELAETIQEVFWVTNADKTKVIYISPAYEKIWRRSCQSLYDQPKSWLEAIHPDDRDRVLRAAAAQGTGDAYDEEYRIVQPDQKIRWVRDCAFPVRNSAGQIKRVVGVARDVTERRQMEEQLRQAQKMEAIGQLAGGVAHDFNNILGAMMMQAELAETADGLPEEVRDDLQQIRASAERAAGLTRQLLMFSRKQVMQSRDLDLNEVVTSVTKMLQRIIGEDVRLQLNLHPSPLMLHADAGMLDQILMNLAVNARDAMPHGGRLLIETGEKDLGADVVGSHTDVPPGRHVWLSVTDTGSGIPPEVLPHIFEPFFTTKDPGKGTGLGLATVFGVIKQHRGWIKVYSESGHGTNFQIFLPACEVAGAATDSTITRHKPRGGTETILLTEDDAPLRLTTRILLERHGYTVLEAVNGVEALKLWEQRQDSVSLLLTDLVMPAGMSGQQLAQKLHVDRPDLKVIFTSGYSAEIAGREFPLRNGENFVQKPFPPDQLLETIRRCLDN